MKSLKLGVLDEIKSLMDSKIGDKLKKPKVAAVEIEAKTIPESGIPDEVEEVMEHESKMPGEVDSMESEDEFGGDLESLSLKGLSDDDKQALKHMYSKMCGE